MNNRIKALEDSNKQLVNSNNQLNNTVKELKDSNKQLIESNKALSDRLDKKDLEIKELNVKLDTQSNEINKLNDDIKQAYNEKDKLRSEKEELYKQLLSSNENRTFLKNELENKDIQINELILNINKKEVVNSLKALSSTNIQNIKCGKYTFKLDDYLKIPLIKNGKKNVLKFKKDNGRLPKYVTIAGIKVSQNVYQKLYNL